MSGPDEFVCRFERVLFETLALPLNGRCWVAFSGGLDSTVLLYLCAAAARRHSLKLSALHADHGLNEAAADWRQHCESVCTVLGVQLHCAALELDCDQGGVEAAARTARYSWFAQMLEPGDVLLTAHHRDDQAETVLLNLLRGSGPRGLRGVHRKGRCGAGMVARPLLAFGRREIREYAQHQKLNWVRDPSNDDTRLARNYLRHRIMPELAQRWPTVAQALGRCASHMDDVCEILDEIAAQDLAKAQFAPPHSVSATLLAALSAPRMRNALRHWLDLAGVRPPSQQITRRLEHLLRRPAGEVRWGPWAVRRYRDRVYLSRVDLSGTRPPDRSWDLRAPHAIPELGMRLRASPRKGTGLDPERLTLPLTVSWRSGGERCRLPGRSHRHALKKLLQGAGVPPWERDRIPLLYSGDVIVAVVGHWYCEPFAASPGQPSVAVEIEPLP